MAQRPTTQIRATNPVPVDESLVAQLAAQPRFSSACMGSSGPPAQAGIHGLPCPRQPAPALRSRPIVLPWPVKEPRCLTVPGRPPACSKQGSNTRLGGPAKGQTTKNHSLLRPHTCLPGLPVLVPARHRPPVTECTGMGCMRQDGSICSWRNRGLAIQRRATIHERAREQPTATANIRCALPLVGGAASTCTFSPHFELRVRHGRPSAALGALVSRRSTVSVPLAVPVSGSDGYPPLSASTLTSHRRVAR